MVGISLASRALGSAWFPSVVGAGPVPTAFLIVCCIALAASVTADEVLVYLLIPRRQRRLMLSRAVWLALLLMLSGVSCWVAFSGPALGGLTLACAALISLSFACSAVCVEVGWIPPVIAGVYMALLGPSIPATRLSPWVHATVPDFAEIAVGLFAVLGTIAYIVNGPRRHGWENLLS